jgi:hypothetical protein
MSPNVLHASLFSLLSSSPPRNSESTVIACDHDFGLHALATLRLHLHSDASAPAKAAKLPVSEVLNSRIAKTTSRKQPRNSSLRRHAWKMSATASGGLPKAPQPKAPSTRVSQRCERAALSTARMRSVHVSFHAAERAGILSAAWPTKLGMAAVMTSTASGGPSKLYVPVEGKQADSEDQRHRGTGAQGHRGTGAQGHRGTGAQGHSQRPSRGALSEGALSGALLRAWTHHSCERATCASNEPHHPVSGRAT